MTHPDAIMQGCFGAGLLYLGCSSSTRCRFEPSLGSEGSDESEWSSPPNSRGAAKGSDGAGQPISAGYGAAVEGPDEARWPDFAGFEAAVKGLDGAGRLDSTGSRGMSSPSYPRACHRKGPAHGEGGSLSLVDRSSHGMGDMELSSSSSSSSPSSSDEP